jgi:hypothetical protein
MLPSRVIAYPARRASRIDPIVAAALRLSNGRFKSAEFVFENRNVTVRDLRFSKKSKKLLIPAQLTVGNLLVLFGPHVGKEMGKVAGRHSTSTTPASS